MIQDIYPHKIDISYKEGQLPETGSLLMVFKGRQFLCRDEEDGISLPYFGELSISAEELIYVFEMDGRKVFLYTGSYEKEIGGFRYADMSLFRTAKPKEVLFAVTTAYHLYAWHNDNRYCGCCGAETVHDEKERMMRCPVCGNRIYPRIMPSVIVGVLNGDSILMTRYNMPGSKLAALVAGFCEIGETAEETVRREVMEETGLRVKNIRYYASQPWGITAGGLLLGYWCDVDGSSEIHVDGEEIAEGAWIRREDLGEYQGPDHPSLTSEMIAVFASGKER